MKLMTHGERQSGPLGLQPDDFGFLLEGTFLLAADETTPNPPYLAPGS